jgi:Sulfotransferase family
MVSDEHRCIFVHIPKTGGTSLEDIIWPGPRTESQLWMGLVSEYYNKYQTGALQHLFASQILLELGVKKFLSYYKFAIVRNPYDRIVSQFVYMRYRPDLRQFIGMAEDDSFSRYLSMIGERRHVQWEEQVEFIHGDHGQSLVDFIGKYERYEQDVYRILEHLGLRRTNLPHALTGQHSAYRDYYGPGDLTRVARMFERDLDWFKYRF